MHGFRAPWLTVLSHRVFKAFGRKLKPDGEYPILSGKQLLNPVNRQYYLHQVRQKAGAPEESFKDVYQPLINTFAAYAQSLPVAEDAESLLDDALATTVRALTYRHGCLLPQGGDAQDMSAQEGLWNYAVMCTALLHNLGRIVTDPLILLLDKRGKLLGQWEPFYGPMGTVHGRRHAHPHRYKIVHWRTVSPGVTHRATLLLAAHLIPPKGMAWLHKNETVFEQVIFCLGGEFEKAGSLGEILRQATMLFEAKPPFTTAADALQPPLPPLTQERKPRREKYTPTMPTAPNETNAADEQMTTAQTRNPLKISKSNPDFAAPLLPSDNAFLTWLCDGISRGQIAVNAPGSFVHRVAEGVFLVSPIVFKAYAEATGQEWSGVQKAFFKQKHHRTGPNGNNIVNYRLNRPGKTDTTLRGVLLENNASIVDGCEVAVSQWLEKAT